MIRPEHGRTVSSLVYLAIFLNLITGLMGFFAAAIVWAIHDRPHERRVRLHAARSFILQIVWLVSLFLGLGLALSLSGTGAAGVTIGNVILATAAAGPPLLACLLALAALSEKSSRLVSTERIR